MGENKEIKGAKVKVLFQILDMTHVIFRVGLSLKILYFGYLV
jgi:hypothetical protein